MYGRLSTCSWIISPKKHTNDTITYTYTIGMFFVFCAFDFFKEGPELMKLFSCSTHLSMKFTSVYQTEKLKNTFHSFELSDVVITVVIKVKMTTIYFNIYEHDKYHTELI